ncbi:hypothetical protein K443DRAFT_674898 [Laccaria amethystina LaAM-08-1]|jgi:hypothetical protein|uniref:Uncharacterized protein n=1 Tax=Laccaria amethystina LaAM-08-1 TaxID=1095629 RepID=A0A0C9X186_9AGAR|nr:hypothetical protein K443DRAFT_674898 [Laccaria amethystina LaAM-08-1]
MGCLVDILRFTVWPFSLDAYLRKLVDQAEITQVDGAFDSGLDWVADVHTNFMHFV